MIRTSITKTTKDFVRWSQKGTCLLCPFPLVLSCHFHHVISVKDFGPEDEFNLVGLCANHHIFIEKLKKTNFQSLLELEKNDVKAREKSYKLHTACKTLHELPQESRELVNLFLARYLGSSDESFSRIFRGNEPCINVAIARNIIAKNVQLYKDVNKYRPRIYFGKPILRKAFKSFDPYDILLLKDTEYQSTIDSVVNSLLEKVCEDAFDFAITEQFIKVGFKYFLDEKEDLNLVFSDDLKFTIKQLREMSDEECFNLR